MNTNAVVAVALLVLACGLAGASSQAQLTGTAAQRGADEGFGDDVSAFMQRGAVATNGSVDGGMWLASFETADNLSRKQVLVRQRATTLDARIDRLETQADRFPPANATPLALRSQRVRLVAERDALRSAVSETKTTAASEGVNATDLDELGRRVENVTIPALGAANTTAGTASTANTATAPSNATANTTATNTTATSGVDATTSPDDAELAEGSLGPSTTYSGP